MDRELPPAYLRRIVCCLICTLTALLVCRGMVFLVVHYFIIKMVLGKGDCESYSFFVYILMVLLHRLSESAGVGCFIGHVLRGH